MLDAGATRLGTSGSATILGELRRIAAGGTASGASKANTWSSTTGKCVTNMFRNVLQTTIPDGLGDYDDDDVRFEDVEKK